MSAPEIISATQPVAPSAEERPDRRVAEVVAVVVAVVATLVAVLAKLGPALIGQQTFGAMDRLAAVSPWTDGGARLPVLNPFLGDSIDTILPAYLQIHDRLMAGDWALWSSLGGPGAELLASASFPTLTLSSIWFLILPTVYAAGFVKAVEVAIAMAGMYLWLRRVGVGRPASVLAGLFYIGSGFVVAWATWPAQSSVAAMMPALFWAVERYLAVKSARSALPIAAVVALLLLGGFPASAGHALYAAGLYFIVRLIASRSAHPGWAGVRVFFGGVGAVVLGVLLSAVQLLPMLTGLAGTDLSERSRQFFSQEPFTSFLSVFFPSGLFGNAFGSSSNPVEAYAFLGMGAVFFALVAVVTGRSANEPRAVVPFFAIGLLLAAALVWQQGWWTDWMANLPVFSGNKSGRLRDLVSLFGSALAGIGVHRVFSARRVPRIRVAVVAAASLAVFVLLSRDMLDRFPELGRADLIAGVGPGIAIVLLALIAVVFVRMTLVRVGAFVLVAVCAAMQFSASVSGFWPLTDADLFYPQTALITEAKQAAGDERVATSGTFMGATTTAYGIRSATSHAFQPATWRDYLESLELGAFGKGQSYTNPSLTFTGTETPAQTALLDRMSVALWVTATGAAVPGAVVDAGAQPRAGTAGVATAEVPAGEPYAVSIAPMRLRGVVVPIAAEVYAAAVNVEITVEVVSVSGDVLASGSIRRTSFGPGDVTIPLAAEDAAASEGPLSIRLTSSDLLTLRADDSGELALSFIAGGDDGLRLTYADAHGAIWQREGAMSRVRWASSAEVITDAEERLARLADPQLPASTVVLSAAGAEAGDAPADISVVADIGDRVSVDVDAAGAGYLVVADGMQRGWAVEIDGEAADLVAADHAFSGVYVTAGAHRVEFTYRGSGVTTGAIATAAGLVIVLLVVVLGTVAERRSRRRAREVSAEISREQR